MTKHSDRWNRVIRVEDIPQAGAAFTLTADEDVRASIARETGVLDLPRLEATFEIDRRGKAGLRVAGQVAATVIQACVVTLEPVTSELDEAIDVVFVPESEREQQKPVDIAIAAEAVDDEPESLVGGTLDLGALATEFLVLGIDPYPRKPDAAFEPPASPGADAGPFAALAALKAKPKASS